MFNQKEIITDIKEKKRNIFCASLYNVLWSKQHNTQHTIQNTQ